MYKCINKKDSFKNLTVNKDYEGEEIGDFIEVINDANVKTRYNKRYFEAVPIVRGLTIQEFIEEFGPEFGYKVKHCWARPTMDKLFGRPNISKEKI